MLNYGLLLKIEVQRYFQRHMHVNLVWGWSHKSCKSFQLFNSL